MRADAPHFRGQRYAIQAVDAAGTTGSLASGPSAPASGPCLLIPKAPPLTGTVPAGGVVNKHDGSSAVTLDRSTLTVDAYTGGVLQVGGQDFTVIGNSASTVEVLNNSSSGAAQEVLPTAGAYTLITPEGTALYGQWLPTSGDDPNAKTKLQLSSKTPYTYFRRNESSVIPPVKFDLCGPDVTEEPICLDISALTADGQPVGVGSLEVGKNYRLDEIGFQPVFFPPNSQVSVGRWRNQNVVYLSGPAGRPPRLDFTFDPPLNMIEVWGQGELEVFANGRSARLIPSVLSSALFDAASARGPIQQLRVQTPSEGSGFITRLCFLPGWTCITVPSGAVGPNSKDIDVAGTRFSSRSATAAGLQSISDSARELERVITISFLRTPLQAFLVPAHDLAASADRILAALPADAAALVEIRRLLADLRTRRALLPPTAPAGTPMWALIGLCDQILDAEPSLLQEGSVTIRFPSPVTRARLPLRGRIGTNVTVRAIGGSTEFAATNQTANAGAVSVTLDTVPRGWIDRLEVTGMDPTVDEICYDRSAFAWHRKQQFENRQQWQQQLAYWYQKDQVLEPDTDYCLRLVTTVTDLDVERPPESWHGFFKTDLPPMGAQPDKSAYPGGGVLATLAAYVWRTVPEDGAGEEGKRPPYRGYDVGVEFNENYVDRLYLRAKRPLGMRILDNNGRLIADVANYWGQSPELRLSEGEQAWVAALELSQSKRCATVDWSEVPGDGTLLASGEELDLQPMALHRAELVARDANTARVVHSFEFTASQFVNFIHHLHSFEDQVWETPVQAITAADFTAAWNAANPKVTEVGQRRTTLKDKADRLKARTGTLTPDDFKAYEDALQAVSTAWTDLEATAAYWFGELVKKFALTLGTLPSVAEISVLRSANGRHALLENPEPLDWHRLKLTLGRSPIVPAATALPPSPLGADVKISGAVVPPSAVATQYSVELLARERTTLDGYKLEVAGDAATPTFGPYFTFLARRVLGTGKRLAIHNAIRPARPEDGVAYLMQDENELLSGAIRNLPEKIAWIRLLNGAGQVVHQRVIQAVENYQSPTGSEITLDLGIAGTDGTRQALMLPNADSTRALLLLQEASIVTIPAGAYLLTLEFGRDIGPEAPTLRASGRTIPEVARLEFVVHS